MEDEYSLNNVVNKKIFRGKYIIPIVFVVLCIFAGYIYKGITWRPKSDLVSERLIRQQVAKQLKKDPNELSDDDFSQIKNVAVLKDKGPLAFSHAEITDIKLLEKFTNLQELAIYAHFPENAIPKWMKVLSKLGVINLDSQFSIDLSALKKLYNLQELFLEANPISSLEPIKGLKNLRRLSLSNTQVSNLNPIKNLANLEIFEINDETQISDIEALKQLKNLKTIRIGNIKISNLKPIKDLINLQTLRLYNTSVSDIEPIKELINLQTLAFDKSFLSDLEHITGLINLQTLSLVETEVSDLKPLKNLKNLQKLYIRDCKNITDEQVEDLQKALPDLKIDR